MKNYTLNILLTVIIFTVISFALKAQTNVSGGIYSDVTWTKANSPYIVTDTVVVFPGVALTIEPGVTVKFADKKRIEIRQANISCVGTKTDSITFTSSSLNPTRGIYAGLYVNGSPSGTPIFNYCNFYYANGAGAYGIIKNCTFSNNGACGYGIDVDSCVIVGNGEGLNGGGNIKNCMIIGNGEGLSGGGSVENCTFIKNNIGFTGNEAIVTDCLFDSNQTAVAFIEECSFINCIIKNGTRGIADAYDFFMHNGSNNILNCTITNNSEFGIFTIPDIPFNGFATDSIIGCQISNNGIGIKDTTSSVFAAVIAGNVIENNTIGLQIQRSDENIYCNKICSNSQFDMYYNVQFGSNGYFLNNYWCTTDSTIISSHIYDGYDNINLGLVHFGPIDTVGCYLTGCNIKLTTTVTNATCDTCHNGSATVNITNGHPNYTFTWFTSPIQSTQTATALASGTYSVCVSDGNGCSACTAVFVDSSNCTGFSIAASGQNATCTLCNDGSAWVHVANGTAPYTYSWYTAPFQSTDTAINLPHGKYAVCVTDLYGCVACDSVTIRTGSCSAHFNLSPDTSAPHHYIAANMASGAGTLTYDWNWGDGSAHDFTPFPSHTYASAGFYNICLTITDTGGCTDTYCNSFYLLRTTNTMIHITVIPPVVTGIAENTGNTSFYLFPNPASDNLTLLLPDNSSKATVKIFNLLGELKLESAIKQKTNVDVSTFSKGVYIIEVSQDGRIDRQKFIKE